MLLVKQEGYLLLLHIFLRKKLGYTVYYLFLSSTSFYRNCGYLIFSRVLCIFCTLKFPINA